MPAVRRLSVTLVATALATAPLAVAPPSAAASYAAVVTTIAGDPIGSGPATALSIPAYGLLPYDGDVLVAAGGVVRRIDLETGVATTFAGIGSGAYATDAGDGGPATAAVFEGANALALAPDGSVYVAEGTGNRLRRIAPDGTISTVAGDRRSQTFSGDGGPAAAATMYSPTSVAVAADGTVYVADSYNNRIRLIGTDGIITTVAGNGVATFGGDGGPATAASLNQPSGVAVDTDGSLLVADSGNHRIRRVRDGVITTVAGIGTAGGPGDGQFGDGVGPNGDGGPAVEAVLHRPGDVSVDGDGYLVTDTLNHKIRRIDANGVITTVAGGGTRGFGDDDVAATDSSLFAPEDAERLPDGRVVIADTRANRVRIIDGAGVIRALGGNFYPGFSGDYGPAVKAQLHHPHFLTTGPDGDTFVMDPLNHGTVIRRIDAATGLIGTVYGWAGANDNPPDDSLAYSTFLRGVGGMTVDSSGALYLVDGHVVRRVDPVTGRQRRYAGRVGVSGDTGDGGHRLDATFVRPWGLYAAPDGSLYVADPGARRIRRIAPDGTVTAFAGNGTPGSGGDGGPATQAQLVSPNTVTGDANGVVYVGDDSAGRVRAIAPDDTISTVVGVGLLGVMPRPAPGPAAEVVVRPTAVSALPDGTLLITDMFENAVRVYDPRTRWVSTLAGSGLAGWRDGAGPAARFAFPGQLGYDALNERVVVADMDNGRVRAISFPYGGRLRRPALSRSAMAYGMRATILGRVARANGTPRAAGTPVTLEFRRNGTTTWIPVKTVTAGLGGWVTTTHAPGASGQYRWTWHGGTGPVSSLGTPVLVRASVTAAWSATRVAAGGTAYLRGAVRPGTEGQPLVVERLVDGAWHPVDEVVAGAGGRFEYVYQAFDGDDAVLRVRRPRDAAHPAAVSPARLLVVE